MVLREVMFLRINVMHLTYCPSVMMNLSSRSAPSVAFDTAAWWDSWESGESDGQRENPLTCGAVCDITFLLLLTNRDYNSIRIESQLSQHVSYSAQRHLTTSLILS